MARLVIFAYCCCSSLMLIVNKLAITHIDAPAFLTLCQFAATSVSVLFAKSRGWIEADGFVWAKMKYFLVYVLAFSGGTWSNMQILRDANVETVIVFRSCAPLAVCVFDVAFHKRALPSVRSLAAMLLIVAGAASYVSHDRSFQVKGLSAYFWVFVWLSLLVFQLTYGKYLVSGLGIKSAWTAVLYTNTLSMLPTGIIVFAGPEVQILKHLTWTANGLALLLLSCALGMGISWAGFKCQSLITATAYTVVGVMNKMVTVLINVIIWDNHASAVGIGSLLICLLGGSFYQQAPQREMLRKSSMSNSMQSEHREDDSDAHRAEQLMLLQTPPRHHTTPVASAGGPSARALIAV